MPALATLFDNPLIVAVLVGLTIGIVAGVVGPSISVAARFAPLSAFGVTYVHAYGGLPAFPPAGSAAKVFYAVGILGFLGGLCDYVPRMKRICVPLALLAPTILIVWIGFFRYVKGGGFELYAFTIAGSLLGAAVLYHLKRIEELPPERNGGPIVTMAVLFGLAAGFAPIALVGGSSTGVGLMAGLACAVGALGLLGVVLPSAGLGWTGILSGMGAVLAACASVALVNGKMDYLALLSLLPAAVSGQVFGKYLLPRTLLPPQLRQVATAMLVVPPVIISIAITYVRHADSFHP
ncbi:hypothetical protein [Rhizobium leguminosarum]